MFSAGASDAARREANSAARAAGVGLAWRRALFVRVEGGEVHARQESPNAHREDVLFGVEQVVEAVQRGPFGLGGLAAEQVGGQGFAERLPAGGVVSRIGQEGIKRLEHG